MWRAIASNALTLFIILFVVVAGLLAWGRQQFSGPGPLADAICFRVERGDSLSKVSRALETQGAVSDARIFRIGADYSEKADRLKFGSYLIPPAASMAQVLEALTAGGQSTCGRDVNYRIGVATAEVVLRQLDPATNQFVEVAKFDPAAAPPQEYTDAVADGDLRWQVTLAEGVTSWQVVDALKKADFLSGEIAAVPPEGTLAPHAYEVDKGASRADLLAKMQADQAQILADLWAARAEGLPYKTPEEAMVMASIVEKETGVPEERPLVASVFVNRLRAGMKLQTDPTVIYGITKGEGVLKRGLRQSELRARTKWNTYVIDGLPPTPIANPGREAIAAALNPAQTDFLYFVADGSGGHAFATTLAQHNENVAKWRAIEAARGQANEGGVQGD
ncbi:MAG: endolytic transglycosylase MltG [Paracoccaceae bacterium]